MKRFFLTALILASGAIIIWAQMGGGRLAKLKTVSFESKTNPDTSLSLAFSFIFVGRPSTYFHNVQENPLRLVVEFYDATVSGAKAPESVAVGPILDVKVEETLEDMTKVQGLSAEIKKLVRVTILLKDKFPYDVADDFNVININGKWSPPKPETPNRKKRKNWLSRF